MELGDIENKSDSNGCTTWRAVQDQSKTRKPSKPSQKGAHCCTLNVLEQCLRVKLSPSIIVVKAWYIIGKGHKINVFLDTTGCRARKLRAEALWGEQ